MWRLREQLPGVAHGTDRITDLVRDAGAQPAQGRELRLLHFRRDEARVLQEDEHGRGRGGAERREMRADDLRAVGADKGLLQRRKDARIAAALPPALEEVQ